MSKEHHAAIAEQVIIGGSLLALTFIALFTLELSYTGMTTGTTAYIVNSTPEICYTSYFSGYNILSFACISTAEPLATVMNNTPLNIMYEYRTSGTDRWKVYNPSLPSYVVSDLNTLTRKNGYITFMGADGIVTFTGSIPSSTSTILTPGWNLVGYPNNATQSVQNAFSTINTSYNIVVTYDQDIPAFISYANPGGGSLQNITVGRGYWVNATQNANWMVTP